MSRLLPDKPNFFIFVVLIPFLTTCFVAVNVDAAVGK